MRVNPGMDKTSTMCVCVCVCAYQAGCCTTSRTSQARKANAEEASSSSSREQSSWSRQWSGRAAQVDQQPADERVERRQQRARRRRLRRTGGCRAIPRGRLVHRSVRRTEARPDGFRQRRGDADRYWSDVGVCDRFVDLRLTASTSSN